MIRKRSSNSFISTPHPPKGLSSNQTMLLALVIGVGLGSVGLLALALMVWLSHQQFGVDRSSKHGISVADTSRLGGLSIVLFLSIMWVLSGLDKAGALNIGLGIRMDNAPVHLWPVLVIGLIGLADDVGFEIMPLARLSTMMVVGFIAFTLSPELLPNRLLDYCFPELAKAPLMLSIASSILLAGFVNAANVSDGANGLLSGLSLVFFWIAWQLQGEAIQFYLLVILLGFWLINTLTGRIMLGDLGAYLIGALMVLVAFDLFDEHGVNPFFLASLLSYPCIEIVRVAFARVIEGRSPLHADNAHLHNLLNSTLRRLLRGNTLPNSLTGLIIVIVSTTPGILIFQMDLQGVASVNLAVFFCQSLAYLSLWALLRRL